jgi:prepilin-type N-terminal cleavage/methylation domain-containing protein
LPMRETMLRLRRPLLTRARTQRGFGMIELLAAMTIMLVGILSVVAVFNAGIVQIRRASKVTTAAAIADSEMEKFRAIRFDSIGLANTAVDAADATYKGNSAYVADTSPTTTLSGAMTSSQLTLSVASASGFPTSSPYIVKIDSEYVLVSGGAGTTSWTVRDVSERGYLGSTAAAHSAGATVLQVRRVNLAACGTSPCTTSVPTKTVTGADGRSYRVDTYVTWRQIAGSGTTTGRLLKYVTIVVRDNTSPYRIWAQIGSSFDESTGV